MTPYGQGKRVGKPDEASVPDVTGLSDGRGAHAHDDLPLNVGTSGASPSGRRTRRRSSGKVTIEDVARAAGVSVTTVSRVLRDHQDVHTETRALVRETVEKLGYRPSPIARALVSGQTRLLALLVSDITNPFYPQLAKSIEREAASSGYMVVICNTEDRVAETRRSVTCLVNQGLDGVIHASAGRDEAALLTVLADPRRVVFTNRPPKARSVSCIVSDNAGGAAALTHHLLEKGHRRIGFIGGPSYARNATERLDGFTRAMREVPDAEPFVTTGDFSIMSGEKAVTKWLGSKCELSAIIAVNDSVAVGAMGALVSRGYKLPVDMALAGFDGTEIAASPVVRLTTVDQHVDEMGRRAVRLLLRQLIEPGAFTPFREVLPPQLLVRDSTKGTPRRAKYVGLAAPRPTSRSKVVQSSPGRPGGAR